jgi:hypothetical protein
VVSARKAARLGRRRRGRRKPSEFTRERARPRSAERRTQARSPRDRRAGRNWEPCRSSRFIVDRRSLRAFGAAPPPSLPAGPAPLTLVERRLAIPEPPPQETFDAVFLSQLEGLVADSGVAVSSAAHGAADARGYRETLAAFLAPLVPGGPPIGEEAFLGMSPGVLAERCNGLIQAGRRSTRRDAAQAVESFVVFFQALVPTLGRRRPAR